MAQRETWLAIACTLATLRISKPVDEQGNVVEPVVDVIPGSIRLVLHSLIYMLPDTFTDDSNFVCVSHFVPYDCLITPINSNTEDMIRESIASYE